MVNYGYPAPLIKKWLYLFIFLHITAWTLAPSIVRLNLPMDSIENTIWAQHLDMGYDKNPFINSLLTSIALLFNHHHADWIFYLCSQLMVGICMLAVFQLGKQILPAIYALLGVLLLETMQYYNFHAIDFSDNTIELCMWSLTILFFYHSVKENTLRAWMLTGLFAGLSMMTKYYAVVLLFSMLLFLLIDPSARTRFRQRELYWGMTVFILTIVPNCIWLIQHDFITLRYALIRAQSEAHLFNHVIYPLQFAWQQCLVCLPMLLFLSILCIDRRKNTNIHAIALNNQLFLLILGVGPFLTTVAISALGGLQLHGAWGQPLLSLWGLMLIAWLQPALTRQKLITFITALLSLLLLAIYLYCHALLQPKATSSGIFPGKDIAATLTHEWNTRYHTKLRYIAGSRWLSGNIAFYSSDHPTVYIDWNKNISVAINEANLRKSGGIFVWDLSEVQNATPAEIKQRFTTMTSLTTLSFPWKRNAQLKPVSFLIAYLPPET